jgi:oligosaccharide repeat unit polymerase
MEKEFITWISSSGNNYSFIYILFFIVLLLTVICFLFSKFDILYPPFIGTTSFTFCIGLAALYTSSWNLPMHFNTAIILIVMITVFNLGGFVATKTNEKMKSQTNSLICNEGLIENEDIPTNFWLFTILLLLVCLYLNYKEFLDLASIVTSSQKFSEMLSPVTIGIAQGKIEFSKLFFYNLIFAKAISYTSVLFFYYSFLNKKYYSCFKWAVLIVFYFPFILLTAGRQLFLYFILFSLISLIMVLRKKRIVHKGKNEMFIMLLFFFGFLFFFLSIGVLNGKINSDLGFFRVLVHYAGINISAFDVFINEMNIPDSNYIGMMTLNAVNAIVNHFGFEIPAGISYIPLFVDFGSITTNVYTALMRYISDYGFLGCGIILFLLGFGYTFFYELIALLNYKNWMVLLYAFVSYPIFLIAREERFFNEILASRTVYTFIIMMVFYKLVKTINRGREVAK